MARKKADSIRKQTAAKKATPPAVEKEVSSAVKTAPEKEMPPPQKNKPPLPRKLHPLQKKLYL